MTDTNGATDTNSTPVTNGISALAKAVLDGDASTVEQCLSNGASPNEKHGYPLIIHAALAHNPIIFKLLLDFGASIPDYFFEEVISWQLEDWIIINESEEKELVQIIDMLRSTTA
jgi:ankyrin repeat protein